jgi:hypothetical protein
LGIFAIIILALILSGNAEIQTLLPTLAAYFLKPVNITGK